MTGNLTVGAENIERLSHHNPREEADAAAAVGVGHHVSIADGQEGDGDHPQGLHVIAAQIPVVVMSVRAKTNSYFVSDSDLGITRKI